MTSILDSWNLENSYANLPKQFYTNIKPTPVKKPSVIIFNEKLAKSLGINLPFEDKELLAQLFSGNNLPGNVKTISQAYAGHQFGHFSILGDGRAHLIGEHISPNKERYDIQFKGSGQTPYSRNGDGRAALSPMLREYIISEAMHHLNIPTTRSLAVVSTGESIMRLDLMDGAILTRVASSHIRVGTFEYARKMLGHEELKALADYAIERHHPELKDQENPYLSFLEATISRQAKLIASWMGVGFIHGVMNTDNMAISGETIDYGPCAFMDIFSMNRVFSSIDSYGRYKYGNQAHIAHWNLVKFAESLLPLLHKNQDEALKLAEISINRYAAKFDNAWINEMRPKLGLFNPEESDFQLIQKLFQWMENSKADFTTTFRDLTYENLAENKIYKTSGFKEWHKLWCERLSRNNKTIKLAYELMKEKNPVIIPYNQIVEEALLAAENGDMEPFFSFLSALQNPFSLSSSNEVFRKINIKPISNYQTFCGT